jgi:hypothetical protein
MAGIAITVQITTYIDAGKREQKMSLTDIYNLQVISAQTLQNTLQNVRLGT